MGVGINYKGVGGNRHFDLNGVPTGEADALFKTPRKHKQLLPENFKKALHPMPTDPISKENEGKVKLNAFDMRPDTLDKKTMPGSAVTTSMSGLCLEGEQNNPSVVGTKLYGSHGGKKGYHGFDEFDPPVVTERSGTLGEGKRGPDNTITKSGVPFSYQITSRLVLEKDDLGRQILVEYDRDVQDTALGRTHTVTGERMRIVGVIDPNGDGKEFIHPYEVRWADSLEGEKDGGWIIWIPSAYLLFVDGISVDIAASNKLVAAGGAYSEGWYKLGNLLSSDTSGKLWLHIDSVPSGTFTTNKGTSDTGLYLLVCETEIDIASKKYKAKNSITSALVIKKEDLDTDTVPVADERSLSSIASEYTGTNGQTLHWSIKGFGKFSAGEFVLGSFLQSTTLELVEGEESKCAFLVRDGNSDSVDSNLIAYRTLKIKKDGVSTPFSIAKEDNNNPNAITGIVNNIFYFDGVEQKLDDYKNVPLDGFVYLSAIQNLPEEGSDEDPAWSFQMGNQPMESSGNGKVLNIKLYEFKAGKVVCDYRTTFLTLSSGEGGDYKEFKFNNELVAKVVADKDIDIGRKVIKEGSHIKIEETDDDITISAIPTQYEEQLDGRSIDRNGVELQLKGFDEVYAHPTNESTSNALLGTNMTGAYMLVAVLEDNKYQLKYMPVTPLSIEAAENSGLFFDNVDNEGSITRRLAWRKLDEGDIVDFKELSVYDEEGHKTSVKVLSTGDILIPSVKSGDGIVLQREGTNIKISSAITDIVSGSDSLTVDRDAKGKVTISIAGDTSEEEESPSVGYSGTEKVCIGMSYDRITHQFMASYVQYTYKNGIVVERMELPSETVFTAVEETVTQSS